MIVSSIHAGLSRRGVSVHDLALADVPEVSPDVLFDGAQKGGTRGRVAMSREGRSVAGSRSKLPRLDSNQEPADYPYGVVSLDRYRARKRVA